MRLVRVGGREITTLAQLTSYYDERIASHGYTDETMFYRSTEQHRLKLRAYETVLGGLPSGDQVADIGCGYGAMVDFWPAGLVYSGFDVQPDFIVEARHRHPAYSFDVAAAREIRETFDWVVLVGVISSTPSPKALLYQALTLAKKSVFFDVVLKDRLPGDFHDLNQWMDEDFDELSANGVQTTLELDCGASWSIFRASGFSE